MSKKFNNAKEVADYFWELSHEVQKQKAEIISIFRKELKGVDRGDFPDRDDDHIFNHLSRMVCSCRWIASPLTTIEKELEDARLGWTTEKVCIKVDPLEILQKGRIYCMEKFNGKYIVKDSDISMDEKTLNEYFADPDK